MLTTRTGKYTGNSTYIDQAIRFWDWSVEAGLVDNQTWAVIDGIVEPSCSDSGHTERWTYNVGVYLYGAGMFSHLILYSQVYD